MSLKVKELERLGYDDYLAGEDTESIAEGIAINEGPRAGYAYLVGACKAIKESK